MSNRIHRPFGIGPTFLGGPIWGYGKGGYGTGAYGGGDAPKVELMMQAVVTLGERTPEGHIIEAVTLSWFAIVAAIRRDTNLIHQPDWRKWEEIIAAAYKEEGWSVTLTPRSNDKGRDIIAERSDFGSIRYIDQVKAYKADNLVTLDQVSSMVGVLDRDRGASKGVITTTSDFAPGVYNDPWVKERLSTRLDLRSGAKLIEWLDAVAKKRGGGT